MFECTPRNSGRYPWSEDDGSFGHQLECLLDEMVRQDHAERAHKMQLPLVRSALDLLDDSTVTVEIKALAARLLRSYEEDWTVRFDERTDSRIKELLGK